MNLTDEQWKEVKDYLTDLGNGGAPKHRGNGICYNLSLKIKGQHESFWIDWVVRQSKDWPEHSGNRLYPVPLRSVYQWKGKAGESRRRLCLHLAGKIELPEKKKWRDFF